MAEVLIIVFAFYTSLFELQLIRAIPHETDVIFLIGTDLCFQISLLLCLIVCLKKAFSFVVYFDQGDSS